MAITVNFRTSKGNVTSRQFQKNEGVSVYGKLTGMAGVGEPGSHIRMEIIDNNNNSIYFKENTANLWGDYDFWFRTPLEDAELKIVLTASFSWYGQDRVIIPIGVGNVLPSPAPRPPIEGNLFTVIPLLILGVGFVYLIKIMNE